MITRVRCLTTFQKDDIVFLYKFNLKTMIELSEMFKVCKHTLYKVLREREVVLRSESRLK
jgi:hypothetical protein